MAKIREMDTREFKKQLKKKGFSCCRKKGGHEIWKRPNGETYTMSAHSKTVKAGLVWDFNRQFC